MFDICLETLSYMCFQPVCSAKKIQMGSGLSTYQLKLQTCVLNNMHLASGIFCNIFRRDIEEQFWVSAFIFLYSIF